MRAKVYEKTFRLSKAIENPNYDGRCKNQVRAVKQFDQGQIILVRRWKYENEINGKSYCHEENEYEVVVDGKRNYLSHSNYKELCDEFDKDFQNQNSSEVIPTSLEEAAQLSRTNMETFLIYAVQQLVREGKISPVILVDAYKRNEDDR